MKPLRDICIPGLLDPVMHAVPQPPKPVFDAPEARRRRDLGVARSESSTDPEWTAEAVRALGEACLASETVTSDDVWRILGVDFMAQANPSALGAVFLKAARLGWIVSTGTFKSSERPAAHMKQNRVWRSTLYRTS